MKARSGKLDLFGTPGAPKSCKGSLLAQEEEVDRNPEQTRSFSSVPFFKCREACCTSYQLVFAQSVISCS